MKKEESAGQLSVVAAKVSMKDLSEVMGLRDASQDPDDVIPGQDTKLPQPEGYPAGYWDECDALQKKATDAWGAIYANICMKADGPSFAAVALVPGYRTYVEGPARSNRLEAWKAFIDQRPS